MTHNPRNGDVYNAYNKPFAVIDWLERAPPAEEWLVVIDADMLLRLPFLCRGPASDLFASAVPKELVLDCARGSPLAAYYGYLEGSANRLAEKHLPDVLPRNNTSGGQPAGRRADQVGGLLVVHRDDMRLYMHDWLRFTEDVRNDPEARPCARTLADRVRAPGLLCPLLPANSGSAARLRAVYRRHITSREMRVWAERCARLPFIDVPSAIVRACSCPTLVSAIADRAHAGLAVFRRHVREGAGAEALDLRDVRLRFRCGDARHVAPR